MEIKNLKYAQQGSGVKYRNNNLSGVFVEFFLAHLIIDNKVKSCQGFYELFCTQLRIILIQ